MSRPELAAGTVCWRRVGDEIMVLLIHRTKQQDVSFPKGKLDKGESMPQAAVRETLEETGLSISLGVNLGTISYFLPSGREKVVQYWAAHVPEESVYASTFKPNREIAALEWTPMKEVRGRLSYAADRDLFDVFNNLVERNAIDTFAVILLRHAKAEPRSATWPVDHLRPLSDDGEHQAETLVPFLTAFGPRRVVTSSAARCQQTVAPLAERLNKRPRVKEELSQDFWDTGDIFGIRSVIGTAIRKTKSVVLCTHRPVMPDVARELSLATGSLPGDYLDAAAELPPGGFSVFHISREHPGAGILAVETYPLKHRSIVQIA